MAYRFFFIAEMLISDHPYLTNTIVNIDEYINERHFDLLGSKRELFYHILKYLHSAALRSIYGISSLKTLEYICDSLYNENTIFRNKTKKMSDYFENEMLKYLKETIILSMFNKISLVENSYLKMERFAITPNILPFFPTETSEIYEKFSYNTKNVLEIFNINKMNNAKNRSVISLIIKRMNLNPFEFEKFYSSTKDNIYFDFENLYPFEFDYYIYNVMNSDRLIRYKCMQDYIYDNFTNYCNQYGIDINKIVERCINRRKENIFDSNMKLIGF